MDWTAAVEKNRDALKRVLALLVAMAGLGDRLGLLARENSDASGPARAETLSPAPTISHPLHRAVLRLLRPAEAAARRLVIVAARGLVVPPGRMRHARHAAPRKGSAPGRAEPPAPRAPALSLLDPLRLPSRRRSSASGVPRICIPGHSAPFPIRVRRPGEPVSAAALVRRFQALGRTLDDLPGQAKRFARWRANLATPVRDAPDARAHPPKIRFRRVWPLRPGRPPGFRRKPSHEVHDILNVVHGLAFWALEPSDTS